MKIRSHFHLKKGSRFEAKELFKDFSRRIKEHFGGVVENLSLLDIGYTSGELLYLKYRQPYLWEKDSGDWKLKYIVA